MMKVPTPDDRLASKLMLGLASPAKQRTADKQLASQIHTKTILFDNDVESKSAS
jgi:hypothetical protein